MARAPAGEALHLLEADLAARAEGWRAHQRIAETQRDEPETGWTLNGDVPHP
jgi:hypothetical protein